jgi:ABC-type molybdate transport system ATPase subunit
LREHAHELDAGAVAGGLALDEALDRARREEIMTVIERVRDDLNLPILYVSHDRDEVELLASTIVSIG